MLTPGDEKIRQQKPEYAEIMLFLRQHLLSYNKNIKETFKYFTLFYEYKGKPLCYTHYKDNYVYLGFFTRFGLKHPKLLSEGRKVVKVFKCFVNKDVDVRSLNAILKLACHSIEKKLQP